MKTLLFLLLLIVVVGGGFYWYKNSDHRSLDTLVTSMSSSTVPGTSSSTTMVPPPTIDATWQTYRNKTVDFAFQYPTKGKLAPSFNVKLLPLSSREVIDGCYSLPQGVETTHEAPQKKMVGGIEFCRSFGFTPGTNGSQVDEEYWVAKYEKWFAVLNFSKKITDISKTDLCQTGNASTTARCQPFDFPAYRTQIEQILTTFVHTSATPSNQ